MRSPKQEQLKVTLLLRICKTVLMDQIRLTDACAAVVQPLSVG